MTPRLGDPVPGTDHVQAVHLAAIHARPVRRERNVALLVRRGFGSPRAVRLGPGPA